MVEPLLRLRKLRREFAAGDATVAVLKDIDLDIHAGEMIAIVGVSGSGKSSLMNIFGCLDRPTSGSYSVAGRETNSMRPDELAKLRREHFGFVFQRYHLLDDLDIIGNVEMSALYAGIPRDARRASARSLLQRLGLGDHVGYKPRQLSGGQQQRVSIARALINGGEVILADEPTGALDTKSSEEVMQAFDELHAQGHTIILVTHNMTVAERAQRIIEISDGVVVADYCNAKSTSIAIVTTTRTPIETGGRRWQALRERFFEAVHMALLAMAAHRMRTFLTMLGIIIGIASVVSVVALGDGSQRQILATINALGTNTIDVYPGQSFGDPQSGMGRTLNADDAVALAAQSYIDSATPVVSTAVIARYKNLSATADVTGVGDQYFRVKGLKFVEGSFFNATAVARLEQSAVIDDNTRMQFFGAAKETAIGKILLLGNVPTRVIGVTENQGGGNLSLWVPYTTAMSRMLGQNYLSNITLRVRDDTPMAAAGQAITRLLARRHGSNDFFLNNTFKVRETITKTTQTMKLLMGAIAAIALLVGGIGVMNIMLVSVIQRVREIGLRMAIGARRSDILQQFLIEAVLICLVGGVLGMLLALLVAPLFTMLGGSFAMEFSPSAMNIAFVCSTLIGLIFGFLPARHASRLDPADALARE